jgi:hypothetical protein
MWLILWHHQQHVGFGPTSNQLTVGRVFGIYYESSEDAEVIAGTVFS